MKNIIIPIIAFLFVCSACNRNNLNSSVVQTDSLQTILAQRDSGINEFLSSFNDVERRLDSIAIRQNIISTSSDNWGELNSNTRDRINSEIISINSLMLRNHQLIVELNHKLKSSNRNTASLQQNIQTLQNRVTKKNGEIIALNEKLTNMKSQLAIFETFFDTLINQYNSQSKAISHKNVQLHTAYYLVETMKYLQNDSIIDRKGGLLGIGRTSQLKSNFDNSKFNRIDYTRTRRIAINTKSIKIITSHPSESYILEKENKQVSFLVVTNPEKFWSISKYLVIAKN